MKKLLSVLVVSFIMFLENSIFATDTMIDDKMNNLWIKDEEVIENIRQDNQERKEKAISLYLNTPEYYRENLGISSDDTIMMQQVEDMYAVKENDIFKVYYMRNNIYSDQYALNNCFRYLISDDYYCYMNVGERYIRYNKDGTFFDYKIPDNTNIGREVLDKDGFTYLKNYSLIEESLKEIDISSIQDIRFLVLNGVCCSCLYIDCGTDEYLIRVFNGGYINPEDQRVYSWADRLKLYELYNAKDFFNIISSSMNEMNEVKPTYTTEAESLRADGLLNGNEKGLDLLKPLTRIEATAMLVRAMGYESDQTSDVSYFSDIKSDNWGAKYANIAKDKGITAGVGDNKFAPNDAITASQFATLILRNMGENPDWQTAINTFVERGLITSEQAEKMDLFTRGDMAKIIFEAKQKNMF